MANTRYDSAWTRDEATLLLAGVAKELAVHGFGVGLTGSVLTKGWSQHDLDIIIYPLQSTEGTYWTVAQEALRQAGFELYISASDVKDSWRRKGSRDQKCVEVWLFNKRRVDVFFLR